MQLGESVDIGQLTKKEQRKARYTRTLTLARLLVISHPEESVCQCLPYVNDSISDFCCF